MLVQQQRILVKRGRRPDKIAVHASICPQAP